MRSEAWQRWLVHAQKRMVSDIDQYEEEEGEEVGEVEQDVVVEVVVGVVIEVAAMGKNFRGSRGKPGILRGSATARHFMTQRTRNELEMRLKKGLKKP